MKRVGLLLGLLLVGVGTLKAQTPVTVTGTVYASNGTLATSGYVAFTIKPSNGSTFYYVQGTAIVAPQTGRCGINGSGQIKNAALSGACQVWGNDVITPGNTTYDVAFAPGSVVSNTVHQVLITGTSYDLTHPVFAPPVNVVPQYQTITTSPIAVNLVPAAANVFNVGSSGYPYAAGYFDTIFANTCAGCGVSTVVGGSPLFSAAISGTTLTFTISQAAADTVYGNCTGSLATPSFCSITSGMLPFTLPLSIANGGTGTATFTSYTFFGNNTGSTAAPSVTAWPGSTTQVYWNNGGALYAGPSMVYDLTNARLGIGADGSGGAPCFYMGAFSAGSVICQASGLTMNAAADSPVYLGARNSTQDFEVGGCTTGCDLTPINLPAGTAFLGGGASNTRIYLNDGTSSAGARQGPFVTGVKVPFGTLTPCSSALEGSMQPATDSTTNTWGDTYAGSGTDHVMLYCDGTNWTVMGK